MIGGWERTSSLDVSVLCLLVGMHFDAMYGFLQANGAAGSDLHVSNYHIRVVLARAA